jgi:hypothetical protein
MPQLDICVYTGLLLLIIALFCSGFNIFLCSNVSLQEFIVYMSEFYYYAHIYLITTLWLWNIDSIISTKVLYNYKIYV